MLKPSAIGLAIVLPLDSRGEMANAKYPRNSHYRLGKKVRIPFITVPEFEATIRSRISEYDIYVGSRLRMCRELRGMSRDALARELNLSHQQLQKYEKGQNRISAGHLPKLARLLGVSIAYFYEGLPDPVLQTGGNKALSDDAGAKVLGVTAECLALLRMFLKIRDSRARASIMALIMSLADGGDN